MDVAVSNDLFGIAQKLVRALSSVVVIRLLDKHALLIVALDLVFKVVPIILSSNGAVSFLDSLVHEAVLIHIVSEGLVPSGDDQDSELGVSPFVVIHRLLKVWIL